MRKKPSERAGETAAASNRTASSTEGAGSSGAPAAARRAARPRKSAGPSESEAAPATREPRTFVKYSPVDGRELGRFVCATDEEVHAAVARARAAQPAWREMGLEKRLEILGRLREVVHAEGEAFAQRISDDTGKPLVDSLMTELMSIPLFIDYYRRTAAKTLRPRRVWTPLIFQPRSSFIEHWPMGVIAVISPWNFPFQLAMVPVLSALIAGNTVVLKPSEVTPLTAELMRGLFQRIRMPAGVVEVVLGDGQTGAALCEADVDKIFFTGSVATGRKVMTAAAKKPIPVELELGGKDAFIVCADANLDRAARAAVWGGLINAGQMCISVERILVVDAVHDVFVEKLQREIEKVRVGAPNEHADMGPMTFPPQVETVRRHIADALARGARKLAGRDTVPGREGGLFVAPTLLTNVTPDMEVWREETFGPVLPVTRVAHEDEAVRLANDHIYGLTASVWTRDVARGRAIASRLEAGQVMVNDVVVGVGNPALPFGGVRASGFGRYHGPEGLLTFCHTRAVLVGSGREPTEAFWFPYRAKYPDLVETFHGLLGGNLVKALRAQRRLMRHGVDPSE